MLLRGDVYFTAYWSFWDHLFRFFDYEVLDYVLGLSDWVASTDLVVTVAFVEAFLTPERRFFLLSMPLVIF